MFTQQQKAELVKASLSRIICDNSDVREVPYDPFRFETYPSNYLPCNHLPSINLEVWREERGRGETEARPRPIIKKIYILTFLPFYCTLTWKTFPDLQQCGSPTEIRNGDFILSSAAGKLVALYSCYHGFQLKGAAALACEGNQWSDEAPQCKGMSTIFDTLVWYSAAM